MRPKPQRYDDSLMDVKTGKWRDKERQIIRRVEPARLPLWDLVFLQQLLEVSMTTAMTIMMTIMLEIVTSSVLIDGYTHIHT